MTWLIRHGESESNAGGITSDPAMQQFSRLLREFAIPNGAILNAHFDANELSFRGPITSHLVER